MFVYTGYLDFVSRLTHEESTIRGKTYDNPNEARDQMKRIVQLVLPMNGKYSIRVEKRAK